MNRKCNNRGLGSKSNYEYQLANQEQQTRVSTINSKNKRRPSFPKTQSTPPPGDGGSCDELNDDAGPNFDNEGNDTKSANPVESILFIEEKKILIYSK